MMIELCVIMIGLIMLISVSYKVISETTAYETDYQFIVVNKSCEIQCVLKKHIP